MLSPELKTAIAVVCKHLAECSNDDYRLELMFLVMTGYCEYCGCIDPDNRCQCWNDD